MRKNNFQKKRDKLIVINGMQGKNYEKNKCKTKWICWGS